MGYLRDATMKDARLLFEWVNETSVREQAFCMDKIGFSAHMEWMGHMLAQENARQYIFMCGSTPAGQARVHVHGQEAEIDYSVCLEKRCMGYGTEILGLLAQQVEKDFPSVKRLYGKVKPGNIASQKVFMDAGYVEKYHAFELELGQQGQRPVSNVSGRGGVLFLTNNSNALVVYGWIRQHEKASIYSGRLYLCQLQEMRPSMVVSYNYNYMIREDAISYMDGKIINIHISYLPWNRGFSPNIWSFIDGTPKGVTIHQVDAGLDTGKIMYQKEVALDASCETFATSYRKLNEEAARLLKEKWAEIRQGRYPLYGQEGDGSYHSKQDLYLLKKRILFHWDDNVAAFLQRYRASGIDGGTGEVYGGC